jgi:hypothetical protein
LPSTGTAQPNFVNFLNLLSEYTFNRTARPPLALFWFICRWVLSHLDSSLRLRNVGWPLSTEVAVRSEEAVMDSGQQVVFQLWDWSIFNKFYKTGTLRNAVVGFWFVFRGVNSLFRCSLSLCWSRTSPPFVKSEVSLPRQKILQLSILT